MEPSGVGRYIATSTTSSNDGASAAKDTVERSHIAHTMPAGHSNADICPKAQDASSASVVKPDDGCDSNKSYLGKFTLPNDFKALLVTTTAESSGTSGHDGESAGCLSPVDTTSLPQGTSNCKNLSKEVALPGNSAAPPSSGNRYQINQTELTECLPSSQSWSATKPECISRRCQAPFLKSQSFDYFNEQSLIRNMHPNILLQLPEVRECPPTDSEQPAKGSSASAFSTHMNAAQSLDSACDAIEYGGCGDGPAQIPGLTSKPQPIDARPIYPNIPYSPYGSPYGSPRSTRRRPPLRESRRISIEQSGSFLQLNQYKLMDQIGQGSYGLVKLAYSEEDSTHYAMKILSKRRLMRQAVLLKRGPKRATSPLDRVYREIAVLKKLDHPNVVKLVEVLDDPVEDSLYLVFELVKQGEVLSIPTEKPLSEERAWAVFRETLLGLEYLHFQRIIHGDLKPGNLLITECGHVKIADLGVCNEFLGEDSTMSNGSTAGTPAFRAPETLNLGKNVYCGKAADIWALGATLYSLVFGNVPFLAHSIPILYEKIKNDQFIFPDVPNVSAELRDCIEKMLVKDPAKRITLPQLKHHNWVTAGSSQPLAGEEENCCLVQISEDDLNSVVRSIPKLDTLILIKTMLKKHSFGNPFSRGGISGRAPQRGGSRLERFARHGRSNSAPGAYNGVMDRQYSGEKPLPSLLEHSVNANQEDG